MAQITFTVQTALRPDPFNAVYNLSEADVYRVLVAFGEQFGPFIDPVTGPRARTPGEIMLALVGDMMEGVMQRVANHEREKAIQAAFTIAPPASELESHG